MQYIPLKRGSKDKEHGATQDKNNGVVQHWKLIIMIIMIMKKMKKMNTLFLAKGSAPILTRYSRDFLCLIELCNGVSPD